MQKQELEREQEQLEQQEQLEEQLLDRLYGWLFEQADDFDSDMWLFVNKGDVVVIGKEQPRGFRKVGKLNKYKTVRENYGVLIEKLGRKGRKE